MLISQLDVYEARKDYFERIFFTEEEAELFVFNANNWLQSELKKFDTSIPSVYIENKNLGLTADLHDGILKYSYSVKNISDSLFVRAKLVISNSEADPMTRLLMTKAFAELFNLDEK